MELTANLELPYIMPSQAQKHVTHNEALRMLDAIVQLSVLDRDRTDPPAAPADGDRHIVAQGASGAWADRDGQVAAWQDGGWNFLPPRAGWLCWVAEEDALRHWDGAAWLPVQPGSELQNITRLGIGTTADATNVVAARLNTALWAARTVAEGGNGDLRYTMNKEDAAGVLSLILQSGWSGRAEVGLVGDDDLRLRVSDDGATWRDGLVVEAATGRVRFPNGVQGQREQLAADRTYYVRADGDDGNDGRTDTAAGAFATLQRAADMIYGSLDLGASNVVVQVGDGTYAAGVNVIAPRLGAGTVTFRGNAANPGNVVVSAAGHCFHASGGAAFAVESMELRTTADSVYCLLAEGGAQIRFADLRFGTVGSAGCYHIRAASGGAVEAAGDYAIVAGAAVHVQAGICGIVDVRGRTVTLSGTPAFTTGFAQAATGGQITLLGNSYSGGATGPRYSAILNGVVYVGAGGNPAALPGDAAGTVATGGQYS